MLIADLKNITIEHSTAILFGQRLLFSAVNDISGVSFCEKIIAAVSFLLVKLDSGVKIAHATRELTHERAVPLFGERAGPPG